METQCAALHRLSLLIQRMLDAEMLLDAEGDALLQETDAIRRSLAADDIETTRHHIEQIALLTEAIVQTNSLALTDGQVVIRVARYILNPKTDAGEEPH